MPGLVHLTIADEGRRALVVARGELQVWSLERGHREAGLSGVPSDVLAAAAGSRGPLVVVGSESGTLTALDLARRSTLWAVRAHEGQVISVAVAPNGRTIASGGVDGNIHLWTVDGAARVRSIATESGRVRNLAFDTAGTRLAAAGLWRTRVWRLDDATRPPHDLGASEGVTDLHIRPDGRLLATCNGGTGQVRVWDLAADARTDRWSGHRGAVTGLALANDGETLVAAGADGTIARWRAGASRPDVASGGAGRVGALALSQDGRWWATVGDAQVAAVWDGRTGERALTLPTVGAARAVIFADAGRQLIVGDAEGSLATWDWRDGTVANLRHTTSPDAEILSLAAHPSRLFVGHRNGTVHVREVAGGRSVRTLRSSSAPFSLAVAPEGRVLAVGTFLGAVDLFEIETGRLLSQIKGQTALIGGLDFSRDGALLAVSSRDGSTRLWDVGAGQWLATVASRRPGAERVRFFPDGRRLAVGYEDGEIDVRDLSYYFRYVAGQAEHRLQLLRAGREAFPRAAEVLAWSRSFLPSSALPREPPRGDEPS